MEIKTIYKTTRGKKLALSFFATEETDAAVILFLHGFKGFKDWGFIPWLGKQFSARGFHFLCFNYSQNGISLQSEEFTELDKFARNTYSLELEETLEIAQLPGRGFFSGWIMFLAASSSLL